MNFEFDHEKSMANHRKHGISLEEAQKLWLGPHIQLAARHQGEHRWMIVGKLENRAYSCIFTLRNESVRLISARRSRNQEERAYREKIKEEDNG